MFAKSPDSINFVDLPIRNYVLFINIEARKLKIVRNNPHINGTKSTDQFF